MPLPASKPGSPRPNVFELMLRKRSGPPVKHVELRSVGGARVKKPPTTSQSRLPTETVDATGLHKVDEASLIQQFEQQRAAYAATLSDQERAIFVGDLNDPHHSDTTKRRVSYPREFKLSAIAYALTHKVRDKKTGELE